MPLADPGFLAVRGAAWLLSYAVHSTLALGLLWILVRSRRLPASLEQTLWRTALVGSVVTATLLVLGWDGGALGARLRLAPSIPLPASGLWSPEFPASESAPPGGWNAHLSPAGTWIILALWALTAGWGLVRLGGARRRLHRELGPRRDVGPGPLRARLESLCRQGGVTRPVRLTVAGGLGAPIAIGRDEICLPERALRDLSGEELEGALAHELAHLERRDPEWKGILAGLSAVFFFQPLVGIARRRLGECAEFLADDWAVRHTGADLSLARCLAAVASWHAPGLRAVAVSGMADGESPLLRRVERILGRRPAEPSGWGRALGAAALLLAVWGLAPGVTAVSPRPGAVLALPVAEISVLELSGPLTVAWTPVPPESPAIPDPAPRVEPAPRGRVRTVFVVVPRTRAAERSPGIHRRSGARWRDQVTAPAPDGMFPPHERLHAHMKSLVAPDTHVDVLLNRPLMPRERLRLSMETDRLRLIEEMGRRLQELERLALEREGVLAPLPPDPPSPVDVQL